MKTSKERLIQTIELQNNEVPVFCPAIYDLKPRFCNVPPHLFGQNKKEIVKAIENEIKIFDADIITCAYDIYNIEAEAVGCNIKRQKSIVMPEIETPLIFSLSEVDNLEPITHPRGRMEIFIEAAKTINERYGDKIWVRGGVVGPFSMAGGIYPKDKLLINTIMNPEGIKKLLQYCTYCIKIYIKGFLDNGIDVVIFDSLISPPMLSPKIYESLVFPFHVEIFTFITANGSKLRPFIVGGNTLSIMETLTKTGANQFLIDYNVPLGEGKNILEKYNFAFRLSLPPSLISDNKPNIIAEEVKKIFATIGHHNNLIIGSGILPLHTPFENVLKVKEIIHEFYF